MYSKNIFTQKPFYFYLLAKTKILIFNLPLSLLVLAIFLVNLPQIFAAGNHLDYTFSGNGKLTTIFGNTSNNAQASDVAIQTDRKIVVVGTTNLNTTPDVALARYNSDGTLDTTFGGDGRVTTNFGGNNYASAVAIQPDGKIVIAGYIFPGAFGYDYLVARYNSNGTLDTTFGTNGWFTYSFYQDNDYSNDLTIQSDGKIIVAGRTRVQGNADYLWSGLRLNSNGTLDTSFGIQGRITLNTSFEDGVRDVDMLPDGGSILAGYIGSSNNGTNFSAHIYDSNGDSLTNFPSVDFFGGNDEIREIVRTSDGKFIAAGKCQMTPTGNDAIAVVRYNSNGTLDTSFGTNGKVVTDLSPQPDEARDVTLQADGKIVVAGRVTYYGIESVVLVRYLSDGTLDRTFGTGGKLLTVFGANNSEANAIAFQNELIGADKLVVAGSYFGSGTPVTASFAVARYKLNGAANSTDFSGDGRADFAVFRPTGGNWFISNSANGAFSSIQFGAAGDIPVPGDYDGDGRTDTAVFRPSAGAWYVLYSFNNSFVAYQFGTAEDKPAQGDYDGDGRTDYAVFRPSAGTWYLQRSTLGFHAVGFGVSTDKPAQADFDGDGLTDIAVFRPSDGSWYLQRSILGFAAIQFGSNGDRPVPADYDGDGRADVAVFRASNASWYIQRSLNNSFYAVQWGVSSDVPAPADLDGDGKTDVTVFRPSSGFWYSLKSTDGGLLSFQFGTNGDVPVPSAYTP